MAGLRIACLLTMFSVVCSTTTNEPEPAMTSTVMEPEPSSTGSGPTIVTGSATLSIGNVTAFMADPAAKLAVRSGIAAASGNIPVANVVATFTATRRLEADEAEEEEEEKENSRRLTAGTVTVAYTITVPASMSASVSTIQAITPASLTTAIASAISTAGLSHSVTVTAFTAVVQASTTASPNPSSSDADKFAKLCWGAVFLMFSAVFTA